jgi:hypothetical protein
MAHGKFFGEHPIRHFNGNLFTDGSVLEMTPDEIERIRKAADLDWGAVDPSVFGTLFERGIDPEKRSQLGAHYTSREDIETLIKPVVMDPLRREWDAVREEIEKLLPPANGDGGPPASAAPSARRARDRAQGMIYDFIERLSEVRVLDPACGSGNFLYVTLQHLKNLEKEVIVYALAKGLPGAIPSVGPWQLYGIETNPYAYDLAQMTVWIGYLQWGRANGFPVTQDPLLRAMDNIRSHDAILDLSEPESPKEPDWPDADFIVGNPPFLGGKKMRAELGDGYVDALFRVWKGKVRPEADLCCYWFEKARAQIAAGKCKRAGLLATQGIRGGANRESLKRIKESGDIFFAESDRPWVLDGANVHVSMVGFDDREEKHRTLDGDCVQNINSNLTTITDITQATVLPGNLNIAFMGDTKGGAFEIDQGQALEFFRHPNPNGKPNSDVIIPWANGLDVTRRPRDMFIIDFGSKMSEAEAALYEAPFDYIKQNVWPVRKENNRENYRRFWWRHVEPRPGLVTGITHLPRFVTTPRVSKYRLFLWLSSPTLVDSATFAFIRSEDFFLGVLHSKLHEMWSLKLGTRLETRPRYTPTTCFETFPFPRPTPEQSEAIAAAARELNALRVRWLNPPEWTREEILEFPGSADGPWARYLHDPDDRGIGTVRYPRTVPRDADAAARIAARTHTNHNNQRPACLDNAHRRLDEAVFAAYGWNPSLSEEELLAKLLALNLERAGPPSALPA